MASKPKSGTKFACVLIFETEVHDLEEMAAVTEAIEEAEQVLGDLGDVRVAGDRFTPPEATEPVKGSEDTAVVVPARDPMAVKLS